MSSDDELRQRAADAVRRASEVASCENHIAAAYALDRMGDERAAALHYDAAWALGVPTEQERGFLVGYGSTLRNVGRVDEAIALLGEALRKYPDYPPLTAFLALALLSGGQWHASLATMIDAALAAARPGAFDGYERALSEYQRELLDHAIG